MPLPTPAAHRQLKHRRTIDVQIFARGDGLWEVDAQLVDLKTLALHTSAGPRPPARPIHDLLLRLVVDEKLNIVEAGSASTWVPHGIHCDDHGDAYAGLAGLNLMQGFRRAVHERLGGVRGCTHLTELAQVLPTAVIQAFAGEVVDVRGIAPDAKQPFQLDRCHALRVDGEAVRLHYPRWHRKLDDSRSDHNPGAATVPR